MKPIRLFFVLSIVLLLFSPVVAASEVNPFIGTGGTGYGVGSTFPGPSLPFGMARPGPDTSRAGMHVSFHHCSGYHYTDNQVRGFSHTRLSGIGVVDYGNVLVMPTLNTSGDYDKKSSFRAGFSHDKEEAEPGYYRVELDSGIKAELTATRRCGLHRYTFPEGKRARIVIDSSHSIAEDGTCGASLEASSQAGVFHGRVLNCGSLTGRQGGVEIFFAVKVRGKIKGQGTFGDSGRKTGAWVEVPAGGPVEIEVGLSFISEEQARRHLDMELAGRSFPEVRESAAQAWREALSVIEVKGGTKDQRKIFRTAFYHSMIMPTNVTEAGGLYRGLDAEVHKARGFDYYTDFSLWDTFRTLHPLLNLIRPERSADMMQSLVKMSEQGGYLPKWPTGYRYSSCMIGASAINVLADAYLKGVTGFDAQQAYDASRKLATKAVPEQAGYDGMVGIEPYRELGYVPGDLYRSAASRTIEFSYNDWCLANLAGALGKDEDRDLFMSRSRNWRKLWHEKSGFIRSRKKNGEFEKPFFPSLWTSYYVEGNARQWLWASAHDAAGLIELMGGKEEFAKRLDTFFEKSARRPDTLLPDTYYWHGNEPDIHAAYLFNYADRPDLTQKWVKWIMEEKYKNAPDGLDGNDDSGTLSAWYVFSALGFYPVAGSDLYLVGRPLFHEATVHLPGGDLVIKAKGGPAKDYVRSVNVCGKRLSKPWFTHDLIRHGGEIVFEMSDAPNKGLSSEPYYSRILEEGELPKKKTNKFIDWENLENPVLAAPNRMLKDQAVIYKESADTFYIFPSNRFDENDPQRKTRKECFYRTRDFKTYECIHDPDLKVFHNSPNPGSPDVTRIGDKWYMVFQAGAGDYFRRLYYSTSEDLEDWSPARKLAPGNHPDQRQIDGALARHHGYYFLGYKGDQTFYVTRSREKKLDGEWLPPVKVSVDGGWAENYQFLKLEGSWRMMATARDPSKFWKTLIGGAYTGNHEPYLFEMQGDGTRLEHWANWKDRRRLEVPYEDWNQVMHANSSYLCDFREYDGHFYLFYAGSNDSESFQGRGHGKIGVARSRDLITWDTPGH
ncbi:MAG: GH92 family glycosyl hydrolase [bacterium]